MTDPLDALRTPVTPVEPDPSFAAALRRRLRRALLEATGGAMSDTAVPETAVPETAVPETTVSAAVPAWGPALAPYIAVADARRALDWYVEVFDATRRGAPYVGPDGSIGHAELGIGDAVLMLSEGSAEVPVQPPRGERPFSHTIHVQVADADETVRRARERGAEVEREPVNEPYGRVAVIVDPFGHRWMINEPPAWASRYRHGDVAYITMGVPDDTRAREFYRRVLGWRFVPGSVPGGWHAEDVRPAIGLAGGGERTEVQLCFRVDDIEAAAARVRAGGGSTGPVDHKPYGLLMECLDDQGTVFQLWQPTG